MRSLLIKVILIISVVLQHPAYAFIKDDPRNQKIMLSFDAGGIRGVMEVVMLKKLDTLVRQRLEVRYPSFKYKGLMEYVDYIGGSSVGSIHTVLLSIPDQRGNAKYTIDDLLQFYVDNHDNHFPRDKSLVTRIVPGMFMPLLDSKAIYRQYKKYFANTTFAKIKHKILLTSYNGDISQETVWTNIGTETQRRELDAYIWNIDKMKLLDAVMASTAASLALPAYQIQYQTKNQPLQIYNEVDSAIIGSSPALTLLATVRQLEDIKLSNMLLVSLGSGNVLFNNSKVANAGFVSYASNFVENTVSQRIALDNRSVTIVRSIVESTGGKVYNFEPFLTREVFWDSYNDSLPNIENYIRIAEEYCTTNDKEFADAANRIAEIIVARYGNPQ